MSRFLLLLHLLLCFMAIGLGAIAVFDLLIKELRSSCVIWFARFSLASNVAALLLSVYIVGPAQKVAMVGVYAAGLVALAWRVFHLRGAWRATFAFTLTMIVYLDILALSVQVQSFISIQMWLYSQAALLLAAAGLGIFAARRFSTQTARISYRRPVHRASRATRP